VKLKDLTSPLWAGASPQLLYGLPSDGAIDTTIIAITIVPNGARRSESQKNLALLRPFLSADLPIRELMLTKKPTINVRRTNPGRFSPSSLGLIAGESGAELHQRSEQGERREADRNKAEANCESDAPEGQKAQDEPNCG